MLKKLVIYWIVLLGTINTSYTQPGVFSIDTCFSEEEIIEIASRVQALERNDSLKSRLIANQQQQLESYERTHEYDSMRLNIKDMQLESYERQNSVLLSAYDSVKPKWYDSKWLWYLLGVATTTTVIVLGR